MDFLEYSDVSSEIKGAMCPGRLKLTDQHIIFKNSKTGKVDQVAVSDLEVVNWQRLVGTWGVRVFLKNGTLHRYAGFKEGDQEKLAKFFSQNYKKDMLEKELSLKGWNWGTARFTGSVLSFDVGTNTGFEVPLTNVSQCTTGKNEVTLEFHQNDDSAVSLMEMRFHIPSSELAGDTDPVDAFHKQVMNQASVINLSGDAITTFKEIQCLTPRGRYDVKLYPTFFQLHGKTFDYKIPMSTVLRLFILPHKDGRQMFFVVSLDPPIKQGQTRYHFLVFLFGQEEEISIEVSLTDEELKEKYDGKLERDMTGPTFEVMGKVMKAIIGRKITTPGSFIGHSQTPAVGCSYKATAGYLYPLERGFIYVHKPPVHIRFEEIVSVNFARSGGGTRSFDFEVELKSNVVHTFSSIEKDEYGKLFDFITNKKLRVKNRGKSDKHSFTDDFGNSDQEDEPDAYLARVKAEAEERDDDGGGGSEEESTDEDFNPDVQDSDVAEEYDSSPPDTDSDASGGSASGKSKEKKTKHKSAKTVSEKPRKKREKKVDDGRPKRPLTAFLLWLNATRDKIKSDNPGIGVTDISRKAGELWKVVADKSEWEEKAAAAKEVYTKAMEQFVADGGELKPKKVKRTKTKAKEASSTPKDASSTPKNGSPKKKRENVKAMESANFKSKAYISDVDDSSSDSDDGKKPSVKQEKKEPKSSSDEDVDMGSSDDDKKKPAASKNTAKNIKKEAPKKKKDDTSEEEMDVDSSASEKSPKKKPDAKKPSKPAKKKKDSSEEEMDVDSESDSDSASKKKSKSKKPEPKKAAKEVKKKPASKKKESESEEESDMSSGSDKPSKKKPAKGKGSKSKKPASKKKQDSDDDESDEDFDSDSGSDD